MTKANGPTRLAQTISEVIALRGLARRRGDVALQEAWAQSAGESVAQQTRALAIRNGVLHVAVGNAPLLSELAGFHRGTLVEKLRDLHPHLRIRDLKFRLDGDLGARRAAQR